MLHAARVSFSHTGACSVAGIFQMYHMYHGIPGVIYLAALTLSRHARVWPTRVVEASVVSVVV